MPQRQLENKGIAMTISMTLAEDFAVQEISVDVVLAVSIMWCKEKSRRNNNVCE